MSAQVCEPWTTPDQLCCEGDADTVADCSGVGTPSLYVWTDEEVILAASNILHAKTGYRFPGICTARVWPCLDTCSSVGHPCAPCCGPHAVRLPSGYPILGIVSVEEDGVVLDPASYRLERGNVLVRLDGLRWLPNSFGLPGSTAVETTIEFEFGAEPPVELQIAAAELACELKKSCNGDASCALPPHVQSFARRGVEVELHDLTELMKSGSTGLPMVDHAIAVHGWRGTATMHDPARPYRGVHVP